MDVAEELALTNEEVISFAEPSARLLAKSKIPSEVRTSLVNSGDYTALGVAAIAYVFRILDIMKGAQLGNQRQTRGVPPTHQTVASNGHHSNDTFAVGSVAGFGSYTVG
jgi:hypothetical protein